MNFSFMSEVVKMLKTPDTIIRLARGEIGYHEKGTKKDLDDKTANSGSANWNKYAEEIDTKYPNFYNGKKNGYAWCDVFVDWLFVHAFGEEDGRYMLCQPEKSSGAGCTASYSYYAQKDRIFKDPKPGDQIFFWNSAKTAKSHTGIVTAVQNGVVLTVEGNTNDQVMEKEYKLTDGKIAGYGRPIYDESIKSNIMELHVNPGVTEIRIML